jgi:hypothetical protein
MGQTVNIVSIAIIILTKSLVVIIDMKKSHYCCLSKVINLSLQLSSKLEL